LVVYTLLGAFFSRNSFTFHHVFITDEKERNMKELRLNVIFGLYSAISVAIAIVNIAFVLRRGWSVIKTTKEEK
jgi:hypothetical protein